MTLTRSRSPGVAPARAPPQAGYFPGPPGGGADGLVVRVGNTPRYGPTGLAVVRRTSNGTAPAAFEHVDWSKMVVRCPVINHTHPPGAGGRTAAAPCADDPRIVYRAADETYYMTFGNDSGLDHTLSGRVEVIATSKTPWVADSE